MNPLKLQILLGAVDKLTAPLKAVSGQSRLTAKDLVDTKKKIRDLETQAGQIEGYKTLGAQIGATKAQLKQAEGSFSELQRKIADTPKPTRLMINEFNKAEKALNQLKTKQGEMITRHAQMGESMRKTGINTGNLSESQRRLKTDLAAANTVLDSQRTKLGQLADQQKRLNQVKANYRKTQELRGQIAGHGATALATGTAVGMTTLKPVIEFARAETSVVDLKVSMMGKGGQVRQEFQAISDLATKLGNKLPGTTADFQNMMSTLIQQGMSAKSILGGLGEATAYLGVQLKMPFDQAALFAAKLQDATGTAENDMMGLMDTIQRSFYLGVDSNNMLGAFSALTPALSVLRKTGLDAANTLAPLIVMADQAALSGESAGNAYRKIFQMSMNPDKIAKATKGTGLKLDFTNGKGEFGGIEKMYTQLAKLKNLNTVARLRVLKGIYGDDKETLQALDIMITKGMDGYRATQKKMADQAALQERVNAQLGTLGSLWDAATGTFTNAMVNFGEAIAPEIKAITVWIADLSERLGNWAKKNPELSNTLMKIGAIVSVVTIAFGGLSLAVAAVLGPMAIMKLTFGILGIKGTFLGKAITLLLAPLKWLTIGIFRLGMAMLTTPVGWFIMGIAAIAGGAYLIYKNWDGISKWFTELWDKCKAPVLAWWELVKELASWTPLGLFMTSWDKVWVFFNTLPDGAANKGKAIVQGLIDGITAKWKTLMEKIKTFTQYLPDWFTGGNVTIGQDKTQGPSYLTGNYNQPALSGGYSYGPRIVQTAKPVAARGASSTTQINAPINIVQQPGQSGADLAQEISRELDKRERQAAARGRATLGDRN
ncbi:phage tail tape measure protein [Aeromonas salmonicida]|uniref:phage tail tape measure protein n=1 Tax=Aeromonas salmonicida TaxID=645 RepID=UPI0039A46280